MSTVFPLYKQLDAMDPIAIGCGPTCLRMVAKMVAKYHGHFLSLEYLRNKEADCLKNIKSLAILRIN